VQEALSFLNKYETVESRKTDGRALPSHLLPDICKECQELLIREGKIDFQQ